MAQIQPLGRPGSWTAWQLWRRGEDPLALAHLALRTTSTAVLDALALAATGGKLVLPQVVRSSTVRTHPAHARHVAALALALAGLARSAQEVELATDLYEDLWSRDLLTALAPVHHQGLAQSFFLTGRHDQLRRALGDLTRLPAAVRHELEVDLANPYLASHGASAPATVPTEAHATWERLLSARFTDAGLEPVTVTPPSGQHHEGHLFDRLGSPPGLAGTTGGPLVSVIMPCYRPDEGLLTSLASITGQTWSELEIVVVDDASGPDYAELFDRAVATDDRVRLLRLDRNGGSYLARNAALAQTRGELITIQDADDFSHPRRIEQQARALLDGPASPASRSLAVRARDDLTHQWFGYRAVRDNASSLMVRRTVIDRIGPFAPIRKGADSEYAERLTTLVGPVLDTGSPLAITRLRAGTLSRGDFTYQWAAPERLVFKGTYRAWHRQVGSPGTRGATTDGAVPAPQPGLRQVDPAGPPPFPVPRTFLRGLDSFPDWDQLAVAYLGDFSQGPTRDGTVDPESLAPHASGHDDGAPGRTHREDTGRIGLWHLEPVPPARAARAEMHDDWFDRIVRSDGRLVPLTRDEDVRVRSLVVLDPRVLLLAGAQPCRVSVDEVEVWLTPALLQPDSSGLPVDMLTVADVCRAWWGLRPRWVPAPHLDGSARAALADLVPGLAEPPRGPRVSSDVVGGQELVGRQGVVGAQRVVDGQGA